MKNRFNRCCCDEEQPTYCRICVNGEVGNECLSDLLGEWLRVEVPHPDAAEPGFTARGRVLGTFELGDEEAAFRVAVDFLDNNNYWMVEFKRGDYVTQLEMAIYRVTGGAAVLIEDRQVETGTNVLLSAASYCIAFSSGSMVVTVEVDLGLGGTLISGKDSEFNSGYVAFASLGNAAGSIDAYYRSQTEVTEEGECLPCPPVDAGLPCTCCPNGIASAWSVDLTSLALTDGFWRACDQIDNVYILDRISDPCSANYSEVFPLSYADDGCSGDPPTGRLDCRLDISLSIFQVEGNCIMQLVVGTVPFSQEQDCTSAGTMLIYTKQGPIEELCQGSHTLTKLTADIGIFEQCGGTAPNTINIQSLLAA